MNAQNFILDKIKMVKLFNAEIYQFWQESHVFYHLICSITLSGSLALLKPGEKRKKPLSLKKEVTIKVFVTIKSCLKSKPTEIIICL
jgi:hypothetical protein